MADLQLEMRVRAREEPVGSLSALVYDPTDGEVTHLVVRIDNVPGADRLVSIDDLADVSDDRVTLRITRHEFFQRRTFETSQFLPYRPDDYGEDSPGRWLLPFVSLSEHGATFASHEFAFDTSTHDITHLVMATGHILHHEDVAIPVASIAAFGEDEIRLSLTADEVAELPHVPLE